MIILNTAQKQFLLGNGYVTAKTLDTIAFTGWQNYFMGFERQLNKDKNKYGFNELHLTKHKGCDYDISLIFHNNELDNLLNLK